MNSEVLIIGGGVIGLSIARELKARGVGRLTILDRGSLGAEASWAAAGMLAPNVEVASDPAFHRLCVESLELYPDFCRSLTEDTGIDPELDTSGTLFLAFNDEDVEQLDMRARQLDRGVRDVERLSAARVRDLEPSISDEVREGLLFPNDWQVENRMLLLALRRSSELNGTRVLENQDVSEILTDGDRAIGVRTAGGDHRADAIVLATGAWTSLIKLGDAAVPLDVKPIRGQMVCFGTGSRRLRRVVFSPRGYVTPRADGRVLVGATVEDSGFDKSVDDRATVSLASAGVEIAPMLADHSLIDTWAGLRPYAANGVPILGDVPGWNGLFIATGHYRNGILLAPVTAKILAGRIIDGTESDYLRLFGAPRHESTAARTAIR